MPEKRRAILICLLLAGITLMIYQPVVHFSFINFDDPEYVIYNSHLQNGVNKGMVQWAFTTRYASNWHPLTWISHALDCGWFSMNPGPPHLINLLFHTANTVLWFLVLWQLTGALWRSALAAALFAWHPLHVESVAWISERKDVLSTFFLVLTIWSHAFYARSAGVKRFMACLTALVLFALGLLSKPMVMTAPVILLLLDYWPLKRKITFGVFLEKLPFFALSALDGFATVWAQRGANSVLSLDIFPIPARAANALVSCALYLWKTVWPSDLALPYPFSHFWSFWQAMSAAIFLLAITAWAISRRREQPHFVVGWLWFLVTLSPVIGLTQTGIQSMADRYTYVPLVGIFIMAAWALPASWAVWPRPGMIFGAVTAGALIFLMAATEMQLQFWRNSVALFSHTVAVTKNNIMAEYNLAQALAEQGDETDAIAHYKKALAIEPNRVEAHYNSKTQAHYNLGLIYRKHKQWTEAAAQFRAFAHDEPDTARGHSNLGIALVGLGRTDDAMAEFRVAARLDPARSGEIQLLTTLAAAWAEAGNFPKAIRTAEQARTEALAEGRKDLAEQISKRILEYRSAK